MEDDMGGAAGWIGWAITGVIIGLVIPFFLVSSKYEGLTAEEWFNEYDAELAGHEKLKDCVSNYAYSDDYEELKLIQDCL